MKIHPREEVTPSLEVAYIVAKEKGFEVLDCRTQFAELSTEEAEAGTLKCIEALAPRMNAFYLTDHRGQTIANIENVLKPLFRYKVATWAQSGSVFVKKGVLLSTTQVEYDEYGIFYAQSLLRAFSTAKN